MSAELRWYPAPGKLNLLLHVLGRRPDGYHELQTVFRLIEWADHVGVALREDGELHRLDALPGVPAAGDLCLRAARLLKERALGRVGARAKMLGADLALDKRLPLGGGLGGGSSDAATVLLVLNRLWGLNLDRAELLELGARLGADVPVFVFGENALGEGIGERLTRLVLPPAWYLVLMPQVSVSTKEMFAEDALTRDTKPLKIPPFFPWQGRNDLEPVAVRRYPEIAGYLNWLREQGVDARMTGSGACVFAEFASKDAAVGISAKLPEAMRGCVTRGLERHPLLDLAG